MTVIDSKNTAWPGHTSKGEFIRHGTAHPEPHTLRRTPQVWPNLHHRACRGIGMVCRHSARRMNSPLPADPELAARRSVHRAVTAIRPQPTAPPASRASRLLQNPHPKPGLAPTGRSRARRKRSVHRAVTAIRPQPTAPPASRISPLLQTRKPWPDTCRGEFIRHGTAHPEPHTLRRTPQVWPNLHHRACRGIGMVCRHGARRMNSPLPADPALAASDLCTVP
jgi:hypothetical protein